MNDLIARFLGDVLYYVTRRGTPNKPGDIPAVLIDALKAAHADKQKRGGEPIRIVPTHGVGGQIAYDVVSAFLPAKHKDIKVDFWCATASQVGFFEEMNVLASDRKFSKKTGKATPLSKANLGRWWNVAGIITTY